MNRPLRRRVALALTLCLSASAVLAVTSAANASHSGTGGLLTSSNGTEIRFAGSDLLHLPSGVTDASWSPDGSRAVYVNNVGDIETVRYSDQTDVWYIADAVPGARRSHPTWIGDGYGIVWSEQASAGQPWRLTFARSSYPGLPRAFSPDDAFDYTHPDAGRGADLVYQRQAQAGGVATGTPEIGHFDGFTQAFSPIITDARNPALSPDGTKAAFVRSDGAQDQIWVTDLAGSPAVQVTDTAGDKGDPVWSADGQTIAFGVSGAVRTVPAGGGTEATVANLNGRPSYRSHRPNLVARMGGANRFATVAAISQAHWATAGNVIDTRHPAQSVVLSRSDTFADALSGSALAAAKVGPLLMTPPTSLNAITRAEIIRVLGPSRTATVYLLGGTGAISAAVATEITRMGYPVQRLSGASRYETSIAIANAITPTPDLVLAATGRDFPDALAAGAAAGSYDAPGTSDLSAVVILTDGSLLPGATKTYLTTVTANPAVTVFGIGGPAATAVLPYSGEQNSIAGQNRYETAWLTAITFFGGASFAGLAIGTNWPDALAGGALMATLNGPMLLTPGTSLHPVSAQLLNLDSGSVNTALVFGAASVISDTVLNHAGNLISGPAAFTTATNPTNGLGGPGGIGPSARWAGTAAPAGPARLFPRTRDQIRDAAANLDEVRARVS